MIAWLIVGALAFAGTEVPSPSETLRDEPVSLSDVLDSVDRSLPLLQASAARVEAAEGARLGAWGWLDPTLRAEGEARFGAYDYQMGSVSISQDTPLWGLSLEGGWRLGAGGFPPYETIPTTGSSGELFAGATLPLLKGGFFDKTRAEAAMADAGVDAAQAGFDADRVKLRFAARKAWAAWMAAGAQLTLAEELLSLAVYTQQAIDRQAERGAAARIDALDARRAVLEREAQVQAAHRDLIAAAVELGLYLREADGRPRDLRGVRPPVPTEPPEAPPGHDLAALVAEAQVQRPEVAKLKASRRKADAKLRSSRVDVLPKLDLKGWVERDLPSSGGKDLTTDAKVGAVLELPLALRPGRGDLYAARAEVTAVQAEQTWLTDRIAAEVLAASATVHASWQQARNTAEAADISAQIAAGTRTAWEAGARDLLDVWVRDSKRFETASKAIKAWKDWFVAEAALQAATGRP